MAPAIELAQEVTVDREMVSESPRVHASTHVRPDRSEALLALWLAPDAENWMCAHLWSQAHPVVCVAPAIELAQEVTVDREMVSECVLYVLVLRGAYLACEIVSPLCIHMQGGQGGNPCPFCFSPAKLAIHSHCCYPMIPSPCDLGRSQLRQACNGRSHPTVLDLDKMFAR